MTPSVRSGKALAQSQLPLPLLRQGKVREVYEVDQRHLLVVASDRVSAFDVVMREAIPFKGAVLTQMSAFWFQLLANVFPSHYVTASTAEILERIPRLQGLQDQIAGRAMLALRADPVPFECVVRGFITGSAWAEYRDKGTLAGEPLAPHLVESSRLDPPIFSPATKAEAGHDINVTVDAVVQVLGSTLAAQLRAASFALYQAGRDHAASRGIIIADTKFEFGTHTDGALRLIDEVLTPDSSRFWPRAHYEPGRAQPSFDKQFVRDYLEEIRWNKQPPVPALPEEVIRRTRDKYLDAFRLLSGRELQ